MNKLFYPAIFNVAEEGGYFITFPDFPECITEGDDLQDAYEMTVDGEELPSASDLNAIDTTTGQSVVIVEFDIAEYRRKHNSKAVKKTLTIPEWLNEEALSAGINFSQVLQEALLQKLGHN